MNFLFKPAITMEDVLAYRPYDTATHTASPLINAVANVLYSTHHRELRVIARYLGVEPRKLSVAVEVVSGLSLKEMVVTYRLVQIKTLMKECPDLTSTRLARECGFSSYHALWRFLQIHTGQTPSGDVSEAPRVDIYHQMERDFVKKKR